MHQHRARGGGVGGSNKALGSVQTVVVGREGEPRDVADVSPGRVAAKDDIAEVDEPIACGRGLGRGVMDLDGPGWKVVGEEGDEVLLDRIGSRRVRHARDQDRREEACGIVNIEVEAWRGNAPQAVVGEGRVG